MITVEQANNIMHEFPKTHLKNCKMSRRRRESGSREIEGAIVILQKGPKMFKSFLTLVFVFSSLKVEKIDLLFSFKLI